MAILVLVGHTFTVVQAQSPRTLTLDLCYEKAEANYPLVKQRSLLEQAREYTISNVAKGALPSLAVHGQASYQSDVTRIPVTLPGIEIPTVSRDQYRLYGEVNQPLSDLVTVKRQRMLEVAKADVQAQLVEVELYRIRERVQQLFFGILLIDAQLAQNEVFKKDIETGMARIRTAIEYGAELKSNLDKLKAELLRADQRTIELRSNRVAFVAMLALFINDDLPADVVMQRPADVMPVSEVQSRPELKLFDHEKRSNDLRYQLLRTRHMPKFSLFVQAGVGQPSPVNMLADDLSTYYIGGLRLSWFLSSYYTASNEKQLVALNESMIATRREEFLFNTSLAVRRQQVEIDRLRALVDTDEEIIALRESVKNAATLQLENGVITVNDYIRETNAEDLARQSRILHKTQLLMAMYALNHLTGN